MEHEQDYRSELDGWINMWDDLKGEQPTPPVKPSKQPDPLEDLYASSDMSSDVPSDTYYDYNDSEELFMEEKIQNPIWPDSQGVDQEQPEPRWVSEDLLKEVERLKNRLFEVENTMARMGQGKKWTEKPVQDDGKKLMSEIKKLRASLEKVSSQLGIQDEPTPWKLKEN